VARNFVAASSQYLQIDSAPITAPPFSFACWFKSTDLTTVQTLFWLGDKDVTNESWRVILRGDVAGDPIDAFTQTGVGSVQARSTSGYSSGVWHHALAVFASATSRTIYLDGGNSGTNATNRAPAGADRVALGGSRDSSPDGYLQGDEAEAGLWNVALTASDAAILALGVSPLLVHPASLVAYWPLIGRNSPENDRIGDYPLTVTGATVADHPRIIYARSGLRMDVPTAAVAGVTPYRMLMGVGV
jgi:hypothetical protein